MGHQNTCDGWQLCWDHAFLHAYAPAWGPAGRPAQIRLLQGTGNIRCHRSPRCALLLQVGEKPSPAAPDMSGLDATLGALRSALAAWQADGKGPQKLCYVLEHQYTEAGIAGGLRALKGPDRAAALVGGHTGGGTAGRHLGPGQRTPQACLHAGSARVSKGCAHLGAYAWRAARALTSLAVGMAALVHAWHAALCVQSLLSSCLPTVLHNTAPSVAAFHLRHGACHGVALPIATPHLTYVCTTPTPGCRRCSAWLQRAC